MLFIIPVYGIVKRCESVPLPPPEGSLAVLVVGVNALIDPRRVGGLVPAAA